MSAAASVDDSSPTSTMAVNAFKQYAEGGLYRAHLISMAEYHRWATNKLCAHLETHNVTEEHYRGDSKLFFGSIHNTLNHILLADRIWYGRMVGEPITDKPEFTGLDMVLYEDRAELRAAMLESADTFKEFIVSKSEEDLGAEFSYSNTAGVAMVKPLGPMLGHVFNHATHHRGQITAAVTFHGYEAPELDYLYFVDPES